MNDIDARIKGLRGLLSKATPGTWIAQGSFIHDNTLHEESRHPSRTACVATCHPLHGTNQSEDDAAFIAAAHNDLPALLDEIDRLRAENDKAKQELKRICDAIAVKGGTEHAPTEDAYERACAALQRLHDENAELRARLAGEGEGE
jgi:hypothetical protein